MLAILARCDATDNFCPILNRLFSVLSSLIIRLRRWSESTGDEIHLLSSIALKDHTCMFSDIQI